MVGAGNNLLPLLTFAEFAYPRSVLSTLQGRTAGALLPNVYWLRRQVCRRLPCPGGRGYVLYVLLVLVVRDQQVQLLLQVELRIEL